MVGRDGFEPSKSLTADLQSAPFGHSGTYPYKKLELVDGQNLALQAFCARLTPHTSQLKIIRRIIFLTLLTLSGFESVSDSILKKLELVDGLEPPTC